MRPLLKTIRTVGRIEYDERKLRTVNTKVEGWIEKLYIDYTGRYVQKGEAMAELYSPELVATQEEFLNILKWQKERRADADTGAMLSRDADDLVEAARKRLQRFDISEAQIRRALEQTGKVPEDPDHLQPHQWVRCTENGAAGNEGHAGRKTV